MMTSGERSGHPRGMPLVTRMFASRGSIGILECKLLGKRAPCHLFKIVECGAKTLHVQDHHFISNTEAFSPFSNMWQSSWLGGWRSLRPSSFKQILQNQPARKLDPREACYWSHACRSVTRVGTRSNRILEYKIVFQTESRAIFNVT
jgi:hypothetical protein